jgi:hypothetical protein
MTWLAIIVVYAHCKSKASGLKLGMVLTFTLLLSTGLLSTGLLSAIVINTGSLLFSKVSFSGLALVGEAQAQTDTASATSAEARDAVTKVYREVYCSSNRTLSDWKGDPGAGDFGTVSPQYIEAIKQRIIFFRALAGVPSSVSLDPLLSTYASQAALMMSANKKISHSPDSSWLYYSPDGARAASSSNLSLGTAGPETIDDFIADDGATNSSVGHRRWLLFPANNSFGLGLVDPPQSSYPSATYPSAMALWVIPPVMTASSTAYSWPPPGFVPYSLIFHRWSFSLSGADFSEARIAVTKNGQPLEIILEPIVSGFGDNTIVWKLAQPVTPTETDTVFEVSLSNVRTPHNEIKDFSYIITAYSPDNAGGTQDERVLYNAESANGTGILLAYMASDNFGCIPQRNPDIEILWAQLKSEAYKPFTTVGSRGHIFLPTGFRYLLRLKNSNITAGPFESGPLGILKSPPNNLVDTLPIVQAPTPVAALPLVVQVSDTQTPTTTSIPVATATPSPPPPTTLTVMIAEVTANTNSELSTTSKTRTPTPTPDIPITNIELKVKNVEDSAEILAWTEDSIGMNNRMSQVLLYVTSSPRVNGVRFRSFDTDTSGELRIRLNIKRMLRTFRYQAWRRTKRLYIKACVSPHNVCSKFVLIPNA